MLAVLRSHCQSRCARKGLVPVRRNRAFSIAHRPLRWGIIGGGFISNDFTHALKAVAGAEVVGVATRSQQSAVQFGRTHGIPEHQCHDSYEALAAREDIDVCYVGTIHTSHVDHSKLCLSHGKHVLVEKPVAVNEGQLRGLLDHRQRSSATHGRPLFLMEGMWTRFFPAVQEAQRIVRSGAIGEVVSVQADFGVQFPADAERIWRADLAGGALLDVGIYPIAAATLFLGGGTGTPPSDVKAIGQMAPSGVDTFAAISLQYGDRKHGVISVSGIAQSPEETVVVGTHGWLKLLSPAHCPNELTVTQLVTRTEMKTETRQFPWPKPLPGAVLNFPGSEGFQYQVQAVHDAIHQGLSEHPLYCHDESLVVCGVMDEVRRQIGLKYPME